MGEIGQKITERLFSDYCLLDREGFVIKEKGSIDSKMKIFAGRIFSPDEDFTPEETWWSEKDHRHTHISFPLTIKGQSVLFTGKIKVSCSLSEVRYFLPEFRQKLISESDCC